MIMIKIHLPDKINFVLQVFLKEHVLIEFFLEVIWDLFLHWFISYFWSPSHRTIASRFRAPCHFKAPASTSTPHVWFVVLSFWVRFPLFTHHNLKRFIRLFVSSNFWGINLNNIFLLFSFGAAALWLTTSHPVALICHIFSRSPIRCNKISCIRVVFLILLHLILRWSNSSRLFGGRLFACWEFRRKPFV